MQTNRIILFIFLLLSLYIIIQPVSAMNWTYNFSTSGYTYDLVNSTYLKDWMYYLIITNNTHTNWDLPVMGFAGSIMGPFTYAFKGIGDDSGNIIYLILFGLFIMMVWRQSGKVTIPALIACIVGGGWSMLAPESAWPWASLLLVVAISSQILTFYAKQ